MHVACAASCSLPFELPLCPLRGTPPALRVWSPLPSALLFWMPRSEKACLAAARKDLLGSEGSLNWSREIWILVKRLLGAASRKYSGSQMIPQQAHTHGGDRGWWWVQAKKGRERATRRAQAASVHVACAASCSLPFELPLCPLRGTPPALRVWSPLPSALLFWMPRSEKACLAAARKDLLGSEGSLNWSREIWILVKRLLGAASRKYSGSQMIPLVNSRRQRQSNLPSDVDNGQVEMGNLTMSRSSGMNST